MNYSLEMRNEQLGLVDQDNLDMAPVVIDFVSGKTAYRRKYGHVGGEAISKAVGIKKGHRPNVVDATSGWGRDAFVLATLGCRVHMIERSKMVAKLLEDGLGRAKQDEKIGTLIKNNLSLICGEGQKELLQTPFEPEVIYLDPMFPHKEKSALVKKEMRILQEVVGHCAGARQCRGSKQLCQAGSYSAARSGCRSEFNQWYSRPAKLPGC